MAVTKIKSIKSTLKKALDYIMDDSKTDGSLLISSYGTDAKSAYLEFKMTADFAKVMKDKDYSKQSKNLAYHTIQSFSKEDKISTEKAHEIGSQLADKLTKGKYQYVVTTHIDKGHVHNHIIFNATSFETFKKFDCNKHVFKTIRTISDELCKENGLEIIDATKSKTKGKSYKEWQEDKKGTSWKSKLKIAIDQCIKKVNTYDEFIKEMQQMGYEIKEGKHIAFRAPGQQRFTRAKTLGIDYTEESIVNHIKNKERTNTVRRSRVDKNKARKIPFSLDKKVVYITRKQQIRDVKELANVLKMMRQESITKRSDFDTKINELRHQSKTIKADINELQHKITSYNEIAKYMNTVNIHQSVYDKYKSAFRKKAFYAKHEGDILAYEFAEKKLKELRINPDVTYDQVISSAKGFTQKSAQLEKDLSVIDQKIKSFADAQRKIDQILDHDRQQKNKQRSKEKDMEI